MSYISRVGEGSGQKVLIQGKGFAAVFNRAKGDFDPADSRRTCPGISFPTLHVTRYDLGDLNGPKSPPNARRDKKWGEARWNVCPAWPWALDETEPGTADFRSIKYHIYEADLVAPEGSGLSVHANGDVHFRAALAPGGVAEHLLWRCPFG